MQLKSSAFHVGGPIPVRYTREGENISPEFSWIDLPAGTQSLALILHDPDAPQEGGFTHWVLYNIDSMFNEISEDVLTNEKSADIGL